MRKYILFITLLAFQTVLFSQELETGLATIDDQIEKETQVEILKQLKTLFASYAATGKMESIDAIDKFYYLFDAEAMVFNDFITKPYETTRPFSDYIDHASIKFKEGMQYELSNAKLIRLNVNQDFNYEALISFSKRVHTVLNEEGENIYLESGLNSEQRMTVLIDPYNTSRILITDIEGISEDIKVAKVKEDKFRAVEHMITTCLTGGFGSVNVSNEIEGNPFQELSGSYQTLPGIQLSYGRSLDRSKRLFAKLGLDFSFASVSTNISSFSHMPSLSDPLKDGFIISDKVSSAQSGGGGTGVQTGDDLEEDAVGYIIPSLRNGEGINGGIEEISLFNFQAMLGIGYKVIDGDRGGLMANVMFGPQYIFGRNQNNIRYTGSFEGVKLPTNSLFPIEDLQALEFEPIRDGTTPGSPVLEDYRFDGDLSDFVEDGDSDDNLSWGLGVGLDYIYKIGYSFGVKAGVDYYQSISPYFAHTESSTSTGFLQGNSNTNRTQSVLEEYYEGSRLSRTQFSLGLFFLIEP